MTRLILTVDSDCKRCGGTGRVAASGGFAVDKFGHEPDGLCSCVKPEGADGAAKTASMTPGRRE
jgi:hypothetical protein